MSHSRRHLYAMGEPLGDSATRAKPGGGMLCGGGGDSSSSSSQATSTTNLDKRQVVDNGGLGVSSDSSTVNVTTNSLDIGAIGKAIELSKASLTAANQNFSDVVGMSKTSTTEANKSFSNLLDLSENSFSAANKNFSDVMDMSLTSTAAAYSGLDSLLGFANDVLALEANSQKLISQSASSVGDAYKTAQDMSSGNRMLVAGGLILAGIVAIHGMKKG